MTGRIPFDPNRMKSAPSDADKAIARKLAKTFQGTPSFARKFNRDETFFVDVLTAVDAPSAGLLSFGTIGISNSVMKNDDGTPFLATRVELVACTQNEFRKFDDILYEIAELVSRTGFLCAPGVFLYDILRNAGYKGDMRHIMFEEPFIWPDLATELFGDKTVSFLLVIPVSDAEMQFARKNSRAALGQKIDESGVNIFDLNRPSIL